MYGGQLLTTYDTWDDHLTKPSFFCFARFHLELEKWSTITHLWRWHVVAVSCRSSGHGWFLQPFEAKLWKKGPIRRKYQIKNRSKTKHKGKMNQSKVYNNENMVAPFRGKQKGECQRWHFRWVIWFLSCSGWTSNFNSFTNLQYSDISGRIGKKRAGIESNVGSANIL